MGLEALWSMVNGYGVGGPLEHGERLWGWRPFEAYTRAKDGVCD